MLALGAPSVRAIGFRWSIRIQSDFYSHSTEKTFMTKLKLVSLAILLSLSATAFAQSVATGDLHVTVKDPSGKLVTNATVTASDQAKGLVRQGNGNGQGEYRVLALPPAGYAVTIDAPGFAKLTADNVIVTVGQVADLPITLSVAGTQI